MKETDQSGITFTTARPDHRRRSARRRCLVLMLNAMEYSPRWKHLRLDHGETLCTVMLNCVFETIGSMMGVDRPVEAFQWARWLLHNRCDHIILVRSFDGSRKTDGDFRGFLVWQRVRLHYISVV